MAWQNKDQTCGSKTKEPIDGEKIESIVGLIIEGIETKNQKERGIIERLIRINTKRERDA